jgi:hypothetical protein
MVMMMTMKMKPGLHVEDRRRARAQPQTQHGPTDLHQAGQHVEGARNAWPKQTRNLPRPKQPLAPLCCKKHWLKAPCHHQMMAMQAHGQLKKV